MVLFGKGEVSAIDIIRIAEMAGVRTGISHFGRGGDKRYGGRSVGWKLFRKAKGEATAAYLTRLAGLNGGVSGGLGRAIAVSQGHKEKGVVAVVYTDGSRALMPAKSAAESMGKTTTVKGRPYVRVASVISQAPSVFSLIPLLA